jgi:hypothetical protein
MTDYNFTRALDTRWDIDVGVAAAIQSALPSLLFKVSMSDTAVVVTTPTDLSAPDEALLGTTIATYKAASTARVLATSKASKNQAVDARTNELIAVGFEYPASSGDYFSLSLPAQLKIMAADDMRNDASFAYPVVWNNIDDTGTVSLADAAAVHAFALAAIAAVRATLDAGTTLKTSVNDAADVTGVNAVVDSR